MSHTHNPMLYLCHSHVITSQSFTQRGEMIGKKRTVKEDSMLSVLIKWDRIKREIQNTKMCNVSWSDSKENRSLTEEGNITKHCDANHKFNITAQILTFDICLFVDPLVCDLSQRQQSRRGNTDRCSHSSPCPSTPRQLTSSSQPGRSTGWGTTRQRPQHRFSSA